MYVVSAVAQTSTTQPPPAPGPTADYAITERGPHHRVWSRVTWETNALQRPVPITNSYTELQTGLHRWQNNQWIESVPVITPVAGGAIATQTQHQVTFAANLNTRGAITLTTPDGKTLSSHILGLSYFDTGSGQAVLLATTQDSLGGLVGQNQVLYTNAFDAVAADVQYIYTKAGLEQNVILRAAPPAPEAFGLNPATTRLQVLTEFFDPPVPVQKVSTDKDGTADATLDFGAMQIIRGQAFLAGTAGATNGGIPVAKQWAVVGGRTFLVESVSYSRVAARIAGLAANGGGHTPASLISGEGPDVLAALGDCLPEAPGLGAGDRMELAQGGPTVRAGFVIDYPVVLASQADCTLKGDTTYYVSGAVVLSGTTTVEGGTVVKYSPSSSASVTLTGPSVWKGTMYRPSVFTARDDDTVGEMISGSTHDPTQTHYGNPMVQATHDAEASSFTCFRFSYAATAIQYYYGSWVEAALRHGQFVNCQYGVVNSYGDDTANIYAGNVLFFNVDHVFTLPDYNIKGEHLTVDQAAYLCPWIYLNNSLIVGVAHSFSYNGAGNVVLSSSSGVFQTVGAGSHYLDDNYRLQGSVNVNASLLADLKQRTTYPPTELGANFIIDTVLGAGSYPMVARDGCTPPEVGYHYDPLDYVVSGKTVSAKLTLTSGVVLGTYGGADIRGLSLSAGGSLVSMGSPGHLNQVVRYNTVQEQATSAWSSSSAGIGVEVANSSAQAQFRFTGWSVLGGSGAHFSRGGGTTGFKDCQFAGGQFHSYEGLLGLTNCLWERVYGNPHADDGGQVFAYNNLFRGGTWFFDNETSCEWVVKDNLFDKVAISQSSGNITHGWNGYALDANQSRLSPAPGSGDCPLTTAAYATGPLGTYYYTGTTLSTLENNGSRNVADAGLTGYTVRAEQTPDSGQVDIGFHYNVLAVDGASGWLFTDQGCIAGGQNGAFRAYNDPSQVTASPWSFPPSSGSLKLRMEYEDDWNCAQYNENIQTATAEAVITVAPNSSARLTVDWTGMVEQHNSGYERMWLYVDGCPTGYSQSTQGQDQGECAAMLPVSGGQVVVLQPGFHLLRLVTDTGTDAQYHVGAFYEFDITLTPQ